MSGVIGVSEVVGVTGAGKGRSFSDFTDSNDFTDFNEFTDFMEFGLILFESVDVVLSCKKMN